MDEMTEADWLVSTNAIAMLWHLHRQRVPRFKNGRRKLRLLACAWGRLLAAELPDQWPGPLLELCERYAEGRATKADLAAAREAAGKAIQKAVAGPYRWVGPQGALGYAALAVSMAAHEEAFQAAFDLCHYWAVIPPERFAPRPDGAAVREVFGNPFRPVTVPKLWRTWNGGSVSALAQTIDAERRFGDMPVLADALEEAGCDNADLLAHCRSGGTHLPGCWVLDLVCGRG
jgi:hypothetical protein